MEDGSSNKQRRRRRRGGQTSKEPSSSGFQATPPLPPSQEDSSGRRSLSPGGPIIAPTSLKSVSEEIPSSSTLPISPTTTAARQKKSHPKQLKTVHLSEDLSKLSIKTVSIPSRPDEGGNMGKEVYVTANCWDFSIKSKIVYMYRAEALAVYRIDKGNKVEIRMPAKDKRALIKQVADSLHDFIIYDGGHDIYSVDRLPGIGTVSVEKEMNIIDPLGRDNLVLKYQIMEVQQVSTDDIQQYIDNPKATSLNMPQESIRLIDCMLRTVSKRSLVSFGRSALFYDRPVKVVADKLFSIYKGFITSVRPQWKVRINIDMTFKAFFTAGNLADVMYEKYGDNMARCSTQMAHDLRRIRVETEKFYKSDNGNAYSRRFTVHGVSSVPADRLMIEELKQSVAAYFDQHHHIKLKYPELPCVKVDQKREVYMPMELLNILPYQAPNASKAEVASEVVRCAAVRPQERFRELVEFASTMSKSHPLFQLFQVKIANKPVDVKSRVLQPPTAVFSRREAIQLKAGSWNILDFYEPARRGVEILWGIICVPSNPRSRGDVEKVTIELPKVANRFGVSFSNKPLVIQCHVAQLEKTFAEFLRQGCNFIVFILYDELAYAVIKRLGDLRLGVRTQCVRGSTLRKPNVFPNLLLKLNGKLGGVNWIIPNLVERSNELIMVFGADVTHPAPTQIQQIRKSVAAVVGSVSLDLMRYGAIVRQQATTERGNKTTREIIDNLQTSVVELLMLYLRNTNGRFPKRIIFYRDGVSEGQFENVLVEELAAIQRACTEIRPGEEPAITFIVVQKRHHIRFKPNDPRSRNVEPGTVVDTNITHPREFDFYICSHEGIQGTSKPSHYHILYDDSNFSSDALQIFSYYLCYAYMRCSRSVSYPAPVYYSHLAAFRARDWLSNMSETSVLLDSHDRFKVHVSQTDGMFFL
uniref:Ago3 n=1 Tax=Schistosoma japonicum TaxID=6182 RepID=M4QHU0_SCHJA|nr:Ago3 [Schistosoma japonicum]